MTQHRIWRRRHSRRREPTVRDCGDPARNRQVPLAATLLLLRDLVLVLSLNLPPQRATVNLPLVHVSRIWRMAALVAASAILWGGNVYASGRTTWSTGIELQRRLAQPVDILWSRNPLRSAVASLSQAQQVAILIDRRVDPGQRLDLAIKGVPMEAALKTIAQRCGLGVGRLGPVVYLGPPADAEQLAPLAAAFERAVRQLPTVAQRKFFQSQALRWEDLSTPRDLLAELAQQSGVEIVGLKQVPHDLWAAADLPPMSLVDRLTLIAVQFDLTFKASDDGERIELIPAPISEKHREPTAHPAAASAPKPSPKARGAEPAPSIERLRIQRLTVRAEPLGPVLRQLADRLGLELRIDEKAIAAAGISLDQRVSLKIENATVDELFRQLLKSTGLGFYRRQRVVEISPAE
jgi:hypothetical protein